MPVPERAAERRANIAMRAVWVVVKTHFQGDQTFFTKIDALNNSARLPIPEVNSASIQPCCDIIKVEARYIGLGRAEFAADHDVLAGLIPEIIVERHSVSRVFPTTGDIELFV